MRRRQPPAVVPEPLPARLWGVGVVEDWISPTEPVPTPVGDAEPARPGESDVARAYRQEAQRRLSAARRDWQDANRLAYPATVDEADLSAVRPAPNPPSRLGQQIVEERSWMLTGARCVFRDQAAFLAAS